MRRTLLAGLLLAAQFAVLSAASAHDLWLEPTRFALVVGQTVGVRILVGQDGVGEAVAWSPAMIDRFVAVDAARRRPVLGRPGADPAATFRVEQAGSQLVSYHSLPIAIELEADKFNAYLKEEGLEPILALRAERGQSGAKGREQYVRCAKSLLRGLPQAGPAGPAQGDRILGLPLELVAERDPGSLPAGEDLPVRVLYAGRPLAGALVVAVQRGRPESRQAQRSDAEGRVRFKLGPGAVWLVKAVHMTAAAAGIDADWTSHWASLTFERP